MKNKRILILLILTLITFMLGGIAVVTSLKLKEKATVPVTPNVPVSKPKAAAVNPPDCTTSFTVASIACGGQCTQDADCGDTATLFCDKTNRTPNVCAKIECNDKTDPCNCSGNISCISKEAFKYTSGTAGTYQVGDALAANANVSREQEIVYKISYKNTSAAAIADVVVKDTLPSGVTYVDGAPGCTNASGVITCTVGQLAGNTAGTRSIRVKVKADASGTLNNSAVVSGAGENSNCAIALKVDVPNAPKCNDSCTSDNQCPSDNKCLNGFCRNEKCPSEADCGCPVEEPKCNDYCADDTECPSDLKCVSNKCRNEKCSGDTDCVCPTSTPRPTGTPTPTPEPQEQLPEAGISLPTIAFLAAGGLLLILGVVIVSL